MKLGHISVGGSGLGSFDSQSEYRIGNLQRYDTSVEEVSG